MSLLDRSERFMTTTPTTRTPVTHRVDPEGHSAPVYGSMTYSSPSSFEIVPTPRVVSEVATPLALVAVGTRTAAHGRAAVASGARPRSHQLVSLLVFLFEPLIFEFDTFVFVDVRLAI